MAGRTISFAEINEYLTDPDWRDTCKNKLFFETAVLALLARGLDPAARMRMDMSTSTRSLLPYTHIVERYQEHNWHYVIDTTYNYMRLYPAAAVFFRAGSRYLDSRDAYDFPNWVPTEPLVYKQYTPAVGNITLAPDSWLPDYTYHVLSLLKAFGERIEPIKYALPIILSLTPGQASEFIDIKYLITDLHGGLRDPQTASAVAARDNWYAYAKEVSGQDLHTRPGKYWAPHKGPYCEFESGFLRARGRELRALHLFVWREMSNQDITDLIAATLMRPDAALAEALLPALRRYGDFSPIKDGDLNMIIHGAARALKEAAKYDGSKGRTSCVSAACSSNVRIFLGACGAGIVQKGYERIIGTTGAEPPEYLLTTSSAYAINQALTAAVLYVSGSLNVAIPWPLPKAAGITTRLISAIGRDHRITVSIRTLSLVRAVKYSPGVQEWLDYYGPPQHPTA